MANLKETYDKFKVLGNAKATGMTNVNFAKCCHSAGVVAKPGDKKKPATKKIVMADVDTVFSTAKKGAGLRVINFQEFQEAVRLLDKREGDGNKVSDLIAVASPQLTKVTKTSKTGGVEKMTDASQYTGSHKERFDKDGKGKGIDGRADIVENSGYVGSYKGKDTYDSK